MQMSRRGTALLLTLVVLAGGCDRGSSIRAAIAKLGTTDPKVQAAAAEDLKAFGPAAVPFLLEALGAADDGIREGAAVALGMMQLRAKEVVLCLAGRLSDPVPRVRSAAAGALQELAPDIADALPMLRQALLDGEAATRSLAAGAIGQMGPAGRPALDDLVAAYRARTTPWAETAIRHILPLEDALKFLEDKDPRLRKLGAGALARYPRSEECRAAWRKALEDADPFVSATAAAELRSMDDLPDAWMPTLVRILRESDPETAEEVLSALKKFPEKAEPALPAIAKRLDDPSDQVRLQAVGVLRLRAPAARPALPALRKHAKDEDDVGVEARAILEDLEPATPGATGTPGKGKS
jgi:HEAT repeat protein